VYESSSVDVADASLSAAVRDVTELAITRGYNRKSIFPPWFSNTSMYYIVKKIYFYRLLKKKRITSTTNSRFTENLLGTLSRLRRLEV
jgi:hypothetical protein